MGVGGGYLLCGPYWGCAAQLACVFGKFLLKREYLGWNSLKSCKNGLTVRKLSLAKGMFSTKNLLSQGYPITNRSAAPTPGTVCKALHDLTQMQSWPCFCDLTLTLTLTCTFVFKPVMTSVGVQASVEPAFVRVRPPPVVRLTLWPPWWRWLKDPSHWLWLQIFLDNHKVILTSLIVVFFSCWYNWSNCRFFFQSFLSSFLKDYILIDHSKQIWY